MKFSTVLFILTPFCFFCTENGTGLFLGTVCFVFAIVVKCTEGKKTKFNYSEKPTKQLTSEQYWGIHFLQHYFSLKDKEGAMNTPEDSKEYANILVTMNGGTPVSDDYFEEFAAKCNIKTWKVTLKEREQFDRIQVGKYFLLERIAEKYKEFNVGDGHVGADYILASCRRIGTSKMQTVKNHYSTKEIESIWKSLTTEEVGKAQDWVNEYEQRFLKEVEDYQKNGIKMPTIKKHYKNQNDFPFDKEYGFSYYF